MFARVFAVGLLLATTAVAQSVITTIAGTDWIFPGDAKPAIQAPLGGFLSMGIAVDQDGNIYIADEDNAMVMKVTTDGILHVIAGNGILGYSGDGGPGTAASLSLVTGVALDRAGNAYIVDSSHSAVRKLTPDGIISTLVGNVFAVPGFAGDGGPASQALVNHPTAIAADGPGNIFIADYGNYRVRKIDTSGTITTVAGNGESGLSGDGGKATDAALGLINGIAVDRAGNIYLATTDENAAHGVVRKVDANGIITTVAGGGTSRANNIAALRAVLIPTCVGVDAAGNIYICDYDLFRVVQVDSRG